MYRRTIARIILTCLLLAGCEKPFEPLAPTDIVYSIYGHLDASADRQWVRVMPIRESLETHPDPIDATVTLEEIETGLTVVMTDSLSRYCTLPIPVELEDECTGVSGFLGALDLFAYNFSTTMPIVPGRSYRLTVRRSDGASATATARIPVFESPTMVLRNAFQFPNGTSNVMLLTRGTIQGTRHLGMVLGREAVPSGCGFPFPDHQEFLPVTLPAASEGDVHEVQLSWGDTRPTYVQHPPPCSMGSKRVLAVASAEPWPQGATAPQRLLSHPASINNIEGRGLGFFTGVQTHVFPFAGCTPLDRTLPCTITFSPRSATLVGVVTSECTGNPIYPRPVLPMPVQVRLLAPGNNAIRYDTTDASGYFRFLGLEPGAAHSLYLEQFTHTENGVPTTEFLPMDVENVAVGEAAVDTITIVMAHRRNCEIRVGGGPN